MRDCPSYNLKYRIRYVLVKEHSILVGSVNDPKPSSSIPFFNGDDGSRTHDLWLAKPALSQLSYVPGLLSQKPEIRISKSEINLVPSSLFRISYFVLRISKTLGPGRFGLPTSRLSGVRSKPAELRARLFSRFRLEHRCLTDQSALKTQPS